MSALFPGVDFNCIADGDGKLLCYGVGADPDDDFRQLQMQINRYASALGFAPLSVDGKIGESTRAALRLPAAVLRARGATQQFIVDAANGMIAAPDIATNVRDFIVMLAAAAPAAGSSSAGAIVASNGTLPTVSAPTGAGRSKLIKVGLAVAGLAALGVGGWFAWRRFGGGHALGDSEIDPRWDVASDAFQHGDVDAAEAIIAEIHPSERMFARKIKFTPRRPSRLRAGEARVKSKQTLYKLYSPMFDRANNGPYFYVLASTSGRSGETHLYPARVDGSILEYDELPGSTRESVPHDALIEKAGYVLAPPALRAKRAGRRKA